jgi:hypothetical protein
MEVKRGSRSLLAIVVDAKFAVSLLKSNKSKKKLVFYLQIYEHESWFVAKTGVICDPPFLILLHQILSKDLQTTTCGPRPHLIKHPERSSS